MRTCEVTTSAERQNALVGRVVRVCLRLPSRGQWLAKKCPRSPGGLAGGPPRARLYPHSDLPMSTRCITRPTNYTIVQSCKFRLTLEVPLPVLQSLQSRGAPEGHEPPIEGMAGDRAWHGQAPRGTLVKAVPFPVTPEPRKPPTTRARSRRPPSCLAQSVSLGR